VTAGSRIVPPARAADGKEDLMRLAAALLTAVLAAGCVYSIQPLYTNADLELMPALAGTWGGESPLVRLTIAEQPDSTYLLIYTDEAGKTDRFIGHLTGIGPLRVLDVEPERSGGDHGDSYESQLLSLHAFFVIDRADRWLRVRTLEADSLRAWAEAHPDAVPLVEREGTLVLTAGTADLRRLVTTLAGRAGYLASDSLVRLVPAPPAPDRRGR
jgi:hypothetical protein